MGAQRKKFFDIVPPQRQGGREATLRLGSSKKKGATRAVLPLSNPEGQNEKKKARRGFAFPRRLPFSKRIAGLFAAFLFLFFLVFGMYTKFVEARIRIHPVMEKQDFQEEIFVSAATPSIDISAKTIPGTLIQDSKALSQQFPATGKATANSSAQGTIRVYNKYHLPQVLIANTRFLSDEGKLFRSKSRVVIPAGGFQDVQVVASEPGESYNIGPSTFSLPGLAGSPRYTAVYGESQEPMTGGSLSDTPQVTEDDIAKAKDALSAALLQEGKKSILAKIQEKGDAILMEKAFSQDIEEVESLVSKGAQVSTFQVTGRLNSRALIFQRKDIEAFWKQFISFQLPPEKVLSGQNLQIEFSFQSIDWEQKRMVIKSSASAFAYPRFSLEELRARLGGMSVKEGREFLRSFPQIAEVDITMWPLPLGDIPRDANKIKIFLDLRPN